MRLRRKNDQVAGLANSLRDTPKPPGFGTKLLEQAGEGRMDGKITPGDVVTMVFAFAAFVVFSVSLGIGVGMLADAALTGAKFGLALGLVGGSVLLGIRLVADLLHATPREMEEPFDPDESRGLDVWVRAEGTTTVKRGTILPNEPTSVVQDKLRKAAKATLLDNKRFSKRGAGRYFGDDYGLVLDELLRCGLVQPLGKGPHAGYELSEAGERWLLEFLD